MSHVETTSVVLATLLPFVVVGVVVFFTIRFFKQRSQTGTQPAAAQPKAPARVMTVFVTLLLVATAVSGWQFGWRPEALLLPVGWLATGCALVLLDRILDRRLRGPRPKVVGPVPFWWVFVWALLLGWVAGMVNAQSRAIPTWLNVAVLVALLLAAMVSFCFRFGFRPPR